MGYSRVDLPTLLHDPLERLVDTPHRDRDADAQPCLRAFLGRADQVLLRDQHEASLGDGVLVTEPDHHEHVVVRLQPEITVRRLLRRVRDGLGRAEWDVLPSEELLVEGLRAGERGHRDLRPGERVELEREEDVRVAGGLED